MPVAEFWKYYACIKGIKASEVLDGFTVSMFPNVKQNKRQKLYDQISKQTESVVESSKKIRTLGDFLKSMSKFKGGFGG